MKFSKDMTDNIGYSLLSLWVQFLATAFAAYFINNTKASMLMILISFGFAGAFILITTTAIILKLAALIKIRRRQKECSN